MIQALCVFVAFVVLDIVYALYTLAVAERRILAAAVWAAFIPLLTAVVTIAVVDNAVMVVPAALGAFFGTWLVMALVHRK